MATKYRLNTSLTNTNWSTDNNWSTTSSTGSPNTTAPTSADDVIFNASSAATNLSASGSCLGINFTGYTGTFTHSAGATLNIYGSLTVAAGMTWTISNPITSLIEFKATTTGHTITTNGKTMPGMFFNGAGGGWTLQDALTITSSWHITVTAGTFDSNAKTITAGYLISNATGNARGVDLSSSTITLAGTDYLNFGVGPYYLFATNLTINTGSLVLSCTGNPTTAVDLYFASSGIGNLTISNIFSRRTFYEMYALFGTVVLSGGETAVNGGEIRFDTNMSCFNFSPTGASLTSRLWMRSTVRGVQRTITVVTSYGNAAYGTSHYLDFQDIIAAGAAGTWSGTSYGNALNNSGITFPAAVTRYLVGTNNWNSTSSWAATSNGAAGASAPLCHDNVVLDSNGGTDTVTTGSRILLCANLTCTGSVDTINFSVGSLRYYIFGNVTLASGMTILGGATRYLDIHGPCTFTTATQSINLNINIDAPGHTVTFADAFSSIRSLTLTQGTMVATAAAFSVPTFASNNSYTRAITLGSNTFTITGSGTCFDITTTTGMTFTCGTSTLDFTDATATTKTAYFGGLTYYTIRMSGAGTGTYQLLNGFTCTNLVSTKTNAYTIQFGWFQNYYFASWQITGTVGNVVTITTNAALQHFLNYTGASGSPSASYLNLSYSWIGPAGTAINSTDSGNNTGWSFSKGSRAHLALGGVGK